jgi:hypothetical protein
VHSQARAAEAEQIDDEEEDPEETVDVYPPCTVEELTVFAAGALSSRSQQLTEADDIRRYFCGSGVLSSDIVDDILYEVVEVSAGSLADAVQACASMVVLDLSASAVAAAGRAAGRGKSNGSSSNGSSNTAHLQNGHSSSSSSSGGMNGTGSAAAAASAAVLGADDNSDDDGQADSPLHRKFREKLASGTCTERDLTSMADQLKGREGFAKLKKNIKKALKGFREERELQRQAAAAAKHGGSSAAGAAASTATGAAAAIAPAASMNGAATALAQKPLHTTAAAIAASHNTAVSGAVVNAKQYHAALNHLAIQPDLVLEIAHGICGWFIGKDGSRLKEMQVRAYRTLSFLHSLSAHTMHYLNLLLSAFGRALAWRSMTRVHMCRTQYRVLRLIVLDALSSDHTASWHL